MKLEQLNDVNSAQIRSYLFRFSELLVKIGEDISFQEHYFSAGQNDAPLLNHPLVISFFVEETGVANRRFSEVKKLVDKYLKKWGPDYLTLALALEIYFYSHPRISLKEDREIEAFIRLVAEVTANYEDEILQITDCNNVAGVAGSIVDARTFDISLYYREDEKPKPIFLMPGRKRFKDGNGFIFEYNSLAETVEVRLIRADTEISSYESAETSYFRLVDGGRFDENEAKIYIEKSPMPERTQDYFQQLKDLTEWHKPKNILVKLLIPAKFSHLPRNHAAGLLREERRKFGEFVEKTLKDIETEISEVSHSLITTSYGVKFNTSELIAKGFGKRRSRVITELEDKNSPYSYYEFFNYRRIINCMDEWLKELGS